MNKGKIFLVGFGPGAEAHMSVRALEAIKESDVVIGYSTYIRLVKNLLDGKEIVRKGMTEEIDRCMQAYEHAQKGKTVALISSGDIGIYGMAGPTYEVLLQSGWTPDSDIQVEIVPGSTALSASASLVGAPLTHDFCSISLSDLLTPWPVIAKRLDAAGHSDFVVALYNPKSGRRTGQIEEAQRILLQYRKADTPVAIVKSAYRDLQEIQMVRLDEMKDCKIGMLTTVLIGNSSTFMQEGLMITPRGYRNKYDGITGATLDGEKRGRSLSMGLDGWKACIRQHLRDHPEQPLSKVATHFEATVGEVLSAIYEASINDKAGEYLSASVPAEMLDNSLSALKQWGALRAVVRSEAGAISELFLQADDLSLSETQLKIENEHFHLHVDWSRVSAAWLVRRADRLCGIYFTDNFNQTVFNLSLLRTDGEFNTNALQQFEQLWQQFSYTDEEELAVNE
ncbi:Cobalt-precorrin-3 C(17)-methyltransferase [hydrothermal vent metagenome]|uniref:Cobalt-precorrin-3 C(17)-methyltransferase n=1 Tax=hydrothermal vent metagenome TaxID=652676 RepID=A0A3B1BEW8_9ZZZZ